MLCSSSNNAFTGLYYATTEYLDGSCGMSPGGRPWAPRGRPVRWAGLVGLRLVGGRGRVVGAPCLVAGLLAHTTQLTPHNSHEIAYNT